MQSHYRHAQTRRFRSPHGTIKFAKHVLAPNETGCPADGAMFAKSYCGLLVTNSYQAHFVEKGFGVGSWIGAGSCLVYIFE